MAITFKAEEVKVGHAAECVILGIKDRFENEVIFEYEKLCVNVGEHLRGCVVDYTCNIQSRVSPAGHTSSDPDESEGESKASIMPIMGDQIPMADREVISEPLFSGLKVHHSISIACMLPF